MKGFAESLADWATPSPQGRCRRRSTGFPKFVFGWQRAWSIRHNLEGAWYGNDTVWRTCLDLQRLLHYGNADATLAPQRQRNVITITDAIIGGDGEGPLAPAPVRSGFLTGGANTARRWNG